MRLSCNFVNVYTIVYYVRRPTRTRVSLHARIPDGHPHEEKRACRTKVRGQVGEEVRVGVGVGPVEFKLNAAPCCVMRC